MTLEKELESMVRAWARKEFWPEALTDVDVMRLPPEMFKAREVIGREKFWAIISEEKP